MVARDELPPQKRELGQVRLAREGAAALSTQLWGDQTLSFPGYGALTRASMRLIYSGSSRTASSGCFFSRLADGGE